MKMKIQPKIKYGQSFINFNDTNRVNGNNKLTFNENCSQVLKKYH